MTTPLSIELNTLKTVRLLFVLACVLASLHVAVMLLWYGDHLPFDDWWQIALFDLDEEESFGTWFSAVILLIAGQLSLYEAYRGKHASQRWWLCWLCLGLGFHLLSVDEVAGMHEYLNTAVEDTPWTTFAAVLLGFVALFFLPFLWALPLRTRVLFIVAGLIYVGGAVGVERGTDWYQDNDLLDTLEYNLWTVVEEFMEMSGIILYIYALLDYVERSGRKLALRLE